MLSIDAIRSALLAREPRLIDPTGRRRAAVAMLLHQTGDGPEVLFIERARRAGDPWSGHMAFPGGRLDEGVDTGPRAAAARETHEEVGLVLHDAEPLGQLDDLQGRHSGRLLPMVISAFVWRVSAPGPIETNHEVEQALWVPISHLVDVGRHIDYRYPRSGERYPGIVVGHPERHVVWGLTYRFLGHFFEALGREFPPASQDAGCARA